MLKAQGRQDVSGFEVDCARRRRQTRQLYPSQSSQPFAICIAKKYKYKWIQIQMAVCSSYVFLFHNSEAFKSSVHCSACFDKRAQLLTLCMDVSYDGVFYAACFHW